MTTNQDKNQKEMHEKDNNSTGGSESKMQIDSSQSLPLLDKASTVSQPETTNPVVGLQQHLVTTSSTLKDDQVAAIARVDKDITSSSSVSGIEQTSNTQKVNSDLMSKETSDLATASTAHQSQASSTLQPIPKATEPELESLPTKTIQPITTVTPKVEDAPITTGKSPLPLSTKSKSSPRTSPQSKASKSNKRQHHQIQSVHNHQLLTTPAQKRKRFHSPLSKMYHPYIQPSDTNLEDARKRLHIALDQTRALRLAFTNRVYEKYKVILKLQSLGLETNDIVALIKKDPKTYFDSLLKDVEMIHNEKELEKKEAHSVNAALGGDMNMKSSMDGHDENKDSTNSSLKPTSEDTTSISDKALTVTSSMLELYDGVENSEQLSWFHAGLSLVILPEENVDELSEQFERRQISYRSPFDLETGSRAKDISSAAAVAGNIMLDRVRKGKELLFMKRKNTSLACDDSTTLDTYIKSLQNDDDMASIFSGTKSLSGMLGQNNITYPQALSNEIITGIHTKDSSGPLNDVTSSNAMKAKHLGKMSIKIPTHSPPTYPPGRSNRPRSNNSLVTLLSLSPTIEGRRSNGKLSACASALVTHGISHIPSSKKGGTSSIGHGGVYNHQQSMIGDSNVMFANSPLGEMSPISSLRNKHPFPLSKGANSTAFDGRTQNYNFNTDYNGIDENISENVLLPPLMTSIQRKKQKDEDFSLYCKSHYLQSQGAVKAVNGVLRQFEGCDNDIEQELLFETVTPKTSKSDSKEIDQSTTGSATSDSAQFPIPVTKQQYISNEPTNSDEVQVMEDAVRNEKKTPSSSVRLKRHLTDIGVVDTFRRKETECYQNGEIDPFIVLSVLHGIGYVHNDVNKTNKSKVINPFESFKKKLTVTQNQARKQCGSTFPSQRPIFEVSVTDPLSDLILGDASANEVTKHLSASNRLQCSDIKLASFIPSLRGGGGDTESTDTKMDSDVDNSSAPIKNSQNNQNQTGQLNISQQQSQAHNADMLKAATAAALWNEQQRNDLAAIHAHATSPQQLYSSLLPTTPVQNSINLFRSALPQSINGTHDQYLHTTNQSPVLQTSPIVHSNHLLHRNVDLIQNFNTRQNDWTNLRNSHGLLGTNLIGHNSMSHSALDTSPLGLSSHQAAMLVRGHAAQILLAREHQNLHAQVLAAQCNAAGFSLNHNTVGESQISSSNINSENKQSSNTQSKKASCNDKNDQVSKHSVHRSTIPSSTPTVPENTSKLSNHFKSKSQDSSNTKKINNNKPNKSDDLVKKRCELTLKKQETGGDDSLIQNVKKTIDMSTEEHKDNMEHDQDCNETEKPVQPSAEDVKSNSHAFIKNSHDEKVCEPDSGDNINGISDNRHLLESSKPEKHNQNTESLDNDITIKINQKSFDDTNKSLEPPEQSSKQTGAPTLPSTHVSYIKLIIPPHPEVLSDSDADRILKGKFHLVTNKIESDSHTKSSLDFLLQVGSAIPIPNVLIEDKLRNKLKEPCCKPLLALLEPETESIISPISILNATILSWLWSNHNKAFETSYKQVHTDPHSSWLIDAAVEVVVRHLISKCSELQGQVTSMGQISERKFEYDELNRQIAVHASLVLAHGIHCNEEMDYILPNFDPLLDHLDNLRLASLKLRSQERALLGSLVSRRSRMSEVFSHAYTSSMIRSGEALGYDNLGELVQDEWTNTSTLLPFDIISDNFEWEDPCRPIGGFIPGLDSDELFKRAHARAMIQKSLKKLQDRHLIKGGIGEAGPYTDIQPSDQSKLTIKAANGVSSVSPPKASPRSSSGTKRKSSISSIADTNNVPAVFHPNHYSSPFAWDTDSIENTPYGRFSQYNNGYKRLRQTSFQQGQTDVDTDEDINQMNDFISSNNDGDGSLRSTREIEWSNVARLFRPVMITEKSSRIVDHHSVAVPAGSTIIAPFCRKVAFHNTGTEELYTISDDDSDSETEEEMDDEKILESHQEVLNHLREKFNAMILIRQQIQERQRRARGLHPM